MKKLLITLILLLLSTMTVFTQTCEWAEGLIGYITDQRTSMCNATDVNGNIYIGGCFTSDTLSLNNGISLVNSNYIGSRRLNGFLAKYNSLGECQWAQKIGEENGEYLDFISLDSLGNIYVNGNFNDTINFNNGISLKTNKRNNVYIAKYNPSGICIWAETITGNQVDKINYITNDGLDNIYVIGYIHSDSISFNNGIIIYKNGFGSSFIAKYNSLGFCQLAGTITGTKNGEGAGAECLTFDSLGNYFVSGPFSSDTIYFNNGIFLIDTNWSKDYIAMYNSSGTCLWAELVSGLNSQIGKNSLESIAADGFGNVYLAGYFHTDTINFNNNKFLEITEKNGFDGFIAKYNSLGVCQWAEKIAGSYYDYVYSLSLDRFGNVYIAGFFESIKLNFNNNISLKLNSKKDGYFAKYNSLGVCQWAEKIAGTNNDFTKSISVDKYNNVYVAGLTNSDKLDFKNEKSITNCAGFLAKYSQHNTSVSEFPIYNLISLHPNPATDFIEISLNNEASLNASEVQIFNMPGIEMMSVGTGLDLSTQRIDVSGLPSGIYYIKIGDKVEKFVKM